MCKCEKKVENENEVAVGVVMGIVDLLDEIFGDAANETKNGRIALTWIRKLTMLCLMIRQLLYSGKTVQKL